MLLNKRFQPFLDAAPICVLGAESCLDRVASSALGIVFSMLVILFEIAELLIFSVRLRQECP